MLFCSEDVTIACSMLFTSNLQLFFCQLFLLSFLLWIERTLFEDGNSLFLKSLPSSFTLVLLSLFVLSDFEEMNQTWSRTMARLTRESSLDFFFLCKSERDFGNGCTAWTWRKEIVKKGEEEWTVRTQREWEKLTETGESQKKTKVKHEYMRGVSDALSIFQETFLSLFILAK